MADKWQAQQQFWSGFGLPAYDELTVPDNAVMPYITYQAVSGNIDTHSAVSASIWYRSNSWQEISKKADEVAQKINNMPSTIKIDDGRMMVRIPYGSWFAQRMEEPNDKQVRRILLSVEIEFLTEF